MHVSSRRRAIGIRLAAVTLGAIVALVLCEAVLRVGGYDRSYVNPMSSFHQPDERLGHVGKPDFSGRLCNPEFDVVIEHDSAGFRRHVNPAPTGQAAPQLFVLGDSFTWGWGVGQGKVFTDLLAAQFGDWAVGNYGLAGAGTVKQAAIFDEHVREKLRSGDTVLLAFFVNDFIENVSGEPRGVVENGTVSIVRPKLGRAVHWRNWLADHCYVFNLARYGIDLTRINRARRRHEAKWQRVAESTGGVAMPPESAEYVVTREMLRRIKSVCDKRQARFVVAFIPGPAELDEAGDLRGLDRQMQAACREAFFRCADELQFIALDLLPRFEEAKRLGRCERVTFRHDLHWTETGHMIAAEAIGGFLKGGAPIAAEGEPSRF